MAPDCAEGTTAMSTTSETRNLALLTGSGLSADALSARGREPCAWAAAQSVPWLLITHERQSGVDAAAALDACGLTVMMPMTGMLARTVAPAATVPGPFTGASALGTQYFWSWFPAHPP